MGDTIQNYSYRFYLVNGIDRVQIQPLGTIALNWELQDETFFYKRTVGSFTVIKDDYFWIKAIEDTGDTCKKLFVEVERKCDGDWDLFARSEWTVQSCRFNNSKCEISVNPDSTGLGSCLMEIAAEQANILQLQTDATGFKYDSITFMSDAIGADILMYGNGHMFYYSGGAFDAILIRPQYVDSSGDPALSGTPTAKPTADELFTAGLIPEDEIDHIAIHRVGIYKQGLLFEPYVIHVAWGYRRAEAKVGGVCPVTPNGYTLIDDTGPNCTYQKKPTDEDRSVTFLDTFDDCASIGVIPSSSDLVYNGALDGAVGIPVGGLCLYVTHKDVQQFSTLTLGAVLQRFIDLCDTKKIPISDFFQINPETVSGINYVTGLATQTADIRFIQRSDAIFFLVADATFSQMSFADLDQILRNTFQTLWSEDVDGNLRLEHYSFYEDLSVGIDTTVGKKAEFTNERINYTYKRELLPLSEEMSDDGNHHNYNWDLRRIRYVDPAGNKLACVGSDSLERSYGVFNTDFEFFIEYPTLIPRGGWVMVACQLGLGFSDEIIAEDSLLNGTLSIKRTVERYYKNGRSALIGQVNGVDVTFETTVKLKEEEALAFPLCCDDDFDPRDFLKTPNGFGRVTTADLNLKTNKLTTNNEY